MLISSSAAFFCGLAYFLLGMYLLSGGLASLSGARVIGALQSMTNSTGKGLLLGAGLTAALQSSSALTVILVGMANSELLTLAQAAPLIMGSNIGSTLTVWILSLPALSSVLSLFQYITPELLSALAAVPGVFLLTRKQPRPHSIGAALCGFSLLLSGMALMQKAMAPLAFHPGFATLLTRFRSPLVGVLVGTIFTGIIQSSAASIGVLQALSCSGILSLGAVTPIVFGQNIGTCVTALLGSIGTSPKARQIALFHLSFNLVGTGVCLLLLLVLQPAIAPLLCRAADPISIAAVHTAFNLVTALLLTPFSPALVRLVESHSPQK